MSPIFIPHSLSLYTEKDKISNFDFLSILHYLRSVILILTGPGKSGKTSLLKKVAAELRSRKIGVCGFLSERVVERGKTIGYDLFDFKTGRAVPYILTKGQKDWLTVGRYFFIPRGLRSAQKIILGHKSRDWLIVDEVGPLELRGEGLCPALNQALSHKKLNAILVVRNSVLERVLKLLGEPDVHVFDIEEKNAFSAMIEKISCLTEPKEP